MNFAIDAETDDLARLLGDLAQINVRHFERQPELGELLWSGLCSGRLIYTFDDGDEWADILTILKEGRFDCEDISAAVAGWAKVHRIRAEVAIGQRKGSRQAHAFNRLGGVIFDFCAFAGMGLPRDHRIYERAVFVEV